MNIQSFLDNLIFLSLLLVTIIYWAGTVYSKFNILEQIGFYGNCFVNFAIFVLLSSRWINFGYFPLSNLYESLMFLAWGITFARVGLAHHPLALHLVRPPFTACDNTLQSVLISRDLSSF